MVNKPVTIATLLTIAITKIDRFDAELLLAYILQKPREFIVTYPEYKLSFFQKYKFLRLVKKRASGLPLAYLNGHKNFFGLNFFVNKYTLVPRPDTEILVEEVLKELKSVTPSTDEITIIDIGTGSGCIPISIAKNTPQKNIQIFATDISHQALKVAQQNSKYHKVQIHFLQGSLLEEKIKKNIPFQNTKILLTANLPYLTQEQFNTERSIQQEPYTALVADDQGLALYKKLLKQIKQYTISGTIFFEIDPSQSLTLSEEIKKLFQTAKMEIIKDLCGRDRIIKIQI